MTEDELNTLVGEEQIQRRAKLAGGRLVHYTTAEAAYQIITGRKVWLRNAAVMNDFSEISHGISCLHEAWASPGGAALQEMLERLRVGLRDELAGLFDGHAESLRTHTYLTSLSEHDDVEDQLGRLSMWRAYGGNAGVALVLNSAAFTAATDAMKAYSAPVFYADQTVFAGWFQNWAKRLLAAEGDLRSIDPERIRNILFYAFRIFALGTKHPGFSEEREWRVFNSPIHEGGSPWLEFGIETVRGLPQPLVKLRLFDDEAAGIIGTSPKTLINRIIIGPCNYPLQVRAAMYEALAQAEVEDIESKLCMSLIPLRQS